uniref:SWIM-type domain-containing protein n=1 Tax=Panagrolaimus sp. ES5 TaxID=591445 RepID=A0AC34FDM8_9BILA
MERMQFKQSQKLLQPNHDKALPLNAEAVQYARWKESANMLFKAKQFHEAVLAYTNILKYWTLNAQDEAAIYSNRCAAYFMLLAEKNSLRMAKADAEKAIELCPNWWKAHYRLGLCHMELEKFEEAKMCFIEALNLNSNSREIVAALSNAEKGLIENGLNYQQRRLLNEIDVQQYRNNPQIYYSDEEFIDGEELKRSGKQHDHDSFGGIADESFDSLVSDRSDKTNSFCSDFETPMPSAGGPQFLSPENEAQVITLESSNDSIVVEKNAQNCFIKVDKIDSTKLVKQIYGYDSSHQGYTIQSVAPDFPPNEKGIHVCIINADHIEKLPGLRDDGLGPWNTTNVKYSIDKVGLFKEDDTYEAVTRKTEGAEKIANLCRMKHPKLKIKKRIYWDFNSNSKNSPVPGTFIVILYEIEETFELTEEQKVKNRRLSKAASAKLDQIIVGRTAKEALEKFYENGGMLRNDKNSLPNITQIRNKMASSKNWKPTTKRGRPKNEDQEEYQRLVNERFIVRSHYIGDDISEERIMLATQAHMHFFKNVLPKTKIVQKIVDLTEELLIYPESERMQKAKELIESDLYKQYKEAGICFFDITFNLSPEFHVSMLLCSCQHIRNAKGDPYVFIAAVLLSKTHKKADIAWFGSEIGKRIGNDVCCRAYMTDSERSLEGMLECSAFKPPCTKLNCFIHTIENVSDYCDKDGEIIRDIFGVTEGSTHVMGLIDEMEFEKFYDKITLMATTDKWSKYEKLQSFVASESRLRYFFDRHNLKARIAGGFGFKQATDNIGECLNMLIKAKTEFKDNMPIQDLIKAIQKVMLGQLADISRVFVHKTPCQLMDQKKFLGDSAWSKLSEEEIRLLLKEIYIINSDLIPGFESRSALPVALAANISEEQRRGMILTAQTYKVFEDEPGTYVVKKGDDLRNINTNTVPIQCKCRMANGKQIICHHILAVNDKFPGSNILQKIENYLKEETVNQWNQRINDSSQAAKPGKRRHSRRRGDNDSRNGNYENVTDYLNLRDYSSSSGNVGAKKESFSGPPAKKSKKTAAEIPLSEIICLDSSPAAQKSRLPQVRIFQSLNPTGQSTNNLIRSVRPLPTPIKINGPQIFLPPPQFAVVRPQRPARAHTQNIMPRPTVPNRVMVPRLRTNALIPHTGPANPVPVQHLAVSNDTVREIVDKYYRENTAAPLPDYLSYNPFILTKTKTLSGWRARNCANVECKVHLGDNGEKVVVSHVEPYSYVDPQTGTTKRTIEARAVCATMLCINRRYPFITKNCFNSELSADETQTVLANITRA